MITMEERTRQFIELTQKMISVQAAKGMDYGESNDGLRNLRRRGVQGVVARMGDKMSRLESLTQPGRTIAVADESIDDTLIDLANYCLLLTILRRDQVEEDGHFMRSEKARQGGLRTSPKPGDPNFKETV